MMPLAASPDVLYYAFGGGMGHVTRAAAILRQLRRFGITRTLALTNALNPLPLQHEALPYHHVASDPATVRDHVPRWLMDHLPRVLVMDVFPHGILQELADVLPQLPCRKVLVSRYLQEPYRQLVRTARQDFDAILCAESSASIPGAVACEPILVRDAGELLPRAEARRRLGVQDAQPVVLGVSSGDAAWEATFFALLRKAWRHLAPDAHLRLVSPRLAGHYPLIELFNGVDIVVGASGYNLFHEVRATGVHGIFLPQPRRYDDQSWRAGGACVVESPEGLEIALRDALAHASTRGAAQYANGAVTAARAIAAMLATAPPPASGSQPESRHSARTSPGVPS